MRYWRCVVGICEKVYLIRFDLSVQLRSKTQNGTHIGSQIKYFIDYVGVKIDYFGSDFRDLCSGSHRQNGLVEVTDKTVWWESQTKWSGGSHRQNGLKEATEKIVSRMSQTKWSRSIKNLILVGVSIKAADNGEHFSFSIVGSFSEYVSADTISL